MNYEIKPDEVSKIVTNCDFQSTIPPEWNSTTYPHAQTKCVHQLFEEQASQTPESIAVHCDGSYLTYKELNARANQLARFLISAGTKPNSFVGISMERSPEMIVGIFGILKAGAAYVPIDPVYPTERVAYMIETAKVSVLLTQSHLLKQFSETSAVNKICLDQDTRVFEQEEEHNLDPVATPEDLIYLIFTSGSTGQPKAAAVYHRNFLNLINWFVTEFAVTETDRNLLVSSLSFDLTQKNLYVPLVCGGQLHMAPSGPYDPDRLSALISEHKISLINCTPSAFYPLVELFSSDSLDRLSSMRIVFLGGEPISIPRMRKWLNHPSCNAKIANTYGPTECTDICGSYLMTKENMDQFPFVPLGRPIHNVQLIVVDEKLQPCPIGEPGELCVAGAGVGAGYINDSVMTHSKFIPNPIKGISGPTIYRTGDKVRWLDSGVIEFLGRMDYQIKIRGFRVELHEIESVLNDHDTIREAVVIVRKGPGGEENDRLVCYFIPVNTDDVKLHELRKYLAEKLPDFMIPSAIYPLPFFPLSPNGKVDRRALQTAPEPVLNLGEHSIDAPESIMEKKIHAIWSTVIGPSQIGMEENFFDVGGNSIHLAQIHVKLQALVKREFPITDLIVHPTIRAAAACMVNNSTPETSTRQFQERANRQRQVLASLRQARG